MPNLPLDLPLLLTQKATLFRIIMTGQHGQPVTLTPAEIEHLDGLLHFVDAVQDELTAQ